MADRPVTDVIPKPVIIRTKLVALRCLIKTGVTVILVPMAVAVPDNVAGPALRRLIPERVLKRYGIMVHVS